jgi:Domain of unknown function (DUF6429)
MAGTKSHSEHLPRRDIDLAKIDDAVLALLFLTRHDGMRAWKGMDWAALERVHAKGLIHDPVNKAKSVVFTEDGLLEAQRVFARDFIKPTPVLKSVRYGKSTAVVQDASGVTGVLCPRMDATFSVCMAKVVHFKTTMCGTTTFPSPSPRTPWRRSIPTGSNAFLITVQTRWA